MTIYTVDNIGVFIGITQHDQLAPLPRCSLTPPPDIVGTEVACLVGSQWVVLPEYPSPTANYKVINGVLVKQIPDTITPRQCRLQLLAEDKLGTVQAAIGSMGESAKIEWEYALEIKRNYSLVLAMMQLFQWTEADADAFFVEAAKI